MVFVDDIALDERGGGKVASHASAYGGAVVCNPVVGDCGGRMQSAPYAAAFDGRGVSRDGVVCDCRRGIGTTYPAPGIPPVFCDLVVRDRWRSLPAVYAAAPVSCDRVVCDCRRGISTV